MAENKIPILTSEQRAAALEKGLQARIARKKTKEKLAAGEIALSNVLEAMTRLSVACGWSTSSKRCPGTARRGPPRLWRGAASPKAGGSRDSGNGRRKGSSASSRNRQPGAKALPNMQAASPSTIRAFYRRLAVRVRRSFRPHAVLASPPPSSLRASPFASSCLLSRFPARRSPHLMRARQQQSPMLPKADISLKP